MPLREAANPAASWLLCRPHLQRLLVSPDASPLLLASSPAPPSEPLPFRGRPLPAPSPFLAPQAAGQGLFPVSLGHCLLLSPRFGQGLPGTSPCSARGNLPSFPQASISLGPRPLADPWPGLGAAVRTGHGFERQCWKVNLLFVHKKNPHQYLILRTSLLKLRLFQLPSHFL